MQLIVNGRFVENAWQDRDQLLDFTVLPLARLQQLVEGRCNMPSAIGLRLSATDVGDVGAHLLASLSLVVVEFESHNDGRGYSIAAKLRGVGFVRELRASGPLLSDQYPQLRACGFDSIEIPKEVAARHTAFDWFKAFPRFPQRYQSTTSTLGSVLEQRHPNHQQNPNALR